MEKLEAVDLPSLPGGDIRERAERRASCPEKEIRGHQQRPRIDAPLLDARPASLAQLAPNCVHLDRLDPARRRPRVSFHFLPTNHIVELNAPFFVDRFASMRWSMLTPDRCAHWDLQHLTFSPGESRGSVPNEDAAEELWRP